MTDPETPEKPAWKDGRKNPYKPRRNSAGRPVEAVTDPPKYIRDRRVPVDRRRRGVTATGRWTPELLAGWRRAWRLTQDELAAAMGVGASSLNRLERGHVPFSRTWVRLLDVELPRIETEILETMRAHRARRLAGSPKRDEQFKPRLYTDQRRFLPGKLVPRDANGVPLR